MTTFDKREKAFEDKYIHEANLKFTAQARRNKRLAVWAGDKLGLSGDAIKDYTKDINLADLTEHGAEDVFRKLKADFAAKSIAITDDEIRTTIAEYYAQAFRELASGM